MKKQIALIITLFAGGFALPAAAQYRGHQRTSHHVEIFISGYHSCGTPIYAKRVYYGRHVRVEPLTRYELRCYLERRQRIANQRLIQRRLARERFLRSRYPQRGRFSRRCR